MVNLICSTIMFRAKQLVNAINQQLINRHHLPPLAKTTRVSTSPCHNASSKDEPNSTLKKIEFEVQLLREQGESIPTNISEKDWNDILNLKSISQRLKYFRHLKRKEDNIEKLKKKKEETRINYLQRAEILNKSEHIAYGLRRNSLFMRFRKKAMDRFYNINLMHAITFGQKLVLDLGYEDTFASKWQLNNCVQQINKLYNINKPHRDPFDVYFCNLKPNTEFNKKLCEKMPFLARTNECAVTVSEKSYLDFFPREKLVYLTPYCRNDLVEFNHDAVYIIGGFIDKNQSVHFELAKAKREGLKMARFPLRKLFNENISLNLDEVMMVLLSLKESNSWPKALKIVCEKLESLHRLSDKVRN